MKLIERNDPQYFSETSDDLYNRHHYKIVTKSGDSIVVDNWLSVREIWLNRKTFLSHIEVLDVKKNSKGFG